MSHELERELIHAYFDGELPTAERAAVERHLAVCRPCQNELAWLKLTAKMIAAECESVIPERLAEVRQAILARFDAMMKLKQPGVEGLKERCWAREEFPFAPRSAGKSDQWRQLARRTDVGRDEAFAEADRLAREIKVELPAGLKSVGQKMRKEE